MRTLLVAGAGLLGLSGVADAQQRVVVHGPGASYPAPRAQTPPPPLHVAPPPRASRWGSKVGGRWWAGSNAPGGWAAYRRPVRGFALPPYWNAARFHVTDWQAHRLPAPPAGYTWVRYYDDAVLIDGRGSVYDTEYAVDWDRYDGGYPEGGTVVAGAHYPPYAPPPSRRGDGLGGATVGAIAGGALGAAVAGRGDRLGGALIGGGVGAVTGYAIDRAEDRRAPPPPPPPGYGAGYPPPVAHGHYPPPVPHGGSSRGWTVYSPDASVQTYTVPAGGSQVIHAGPGLTTITVQSGGAVTTTTTTTEYFDDAVTYTPAKRVVRKRAYRSKLRPRCQC